MRANPDQPWKQPWKPHVTVATIVCDAGRYLLVEERVRGRAVINQPAGHLDPGETLLDAAIRETFEETGYRVALDGVVGVYQWIEQETGRQFLRTTFAARVVGHEPDAPLDEGILGPRWLTTEEVRSLNGKLRNPLVLRNIEDFESRAPFPLELLTDLMS